jgi:tRNA pseudouridine55 synthase
VSPQNGVILVDKPAGITSFQTLGAIKKIACTGKVGHAGTLDKFATGLLVVATGWCTRLAPWFTGLDKQYRATIRFGEETDTLDPEGEVIGTAGIPKNAEVARVIKDFLGPIEQVPPVYSAVHISGERAHRLARAGKPVELQPRRVEISAIEIQSFEPPDMVICVHCSKGTYIRSLARDIGKAAGSRAHVIALRRTHVGPFLVENAVAPDEIQLDKDVIGAASALEHFRDMQKTAVSPEIVKSVRNGQTIDMESLDTPPKADGEIVITDRTGEMIAILDKKGTTCRYRLVVPA